MDRQRRLPRRRPRPVQDEEYRQEVLQDGYRKLRDAAAARRRRKRVRDGKLRKAANKMGIKWVIGRQQTGRGGPPPPPPPAAKV